MTGPTPTAEQAEVIDAFDFGSDLVVEAGAGTGKTSTLKMLARSTTERGVYVAYNRSIAADAARAFPATVTCKTAHGFAYAAVGRHYRHRLNGPRIPAQKTAQILGIREPVAIGTARLSPQQLARLTMETVTRWCYSADDRVQRMNVPLVTGLDRPGQRELAAYLLPLAQRAWDEDLARVDGQLRYQHDHYLKTWILSGPQLPCDYVLLDEAQDSNGAVAGLVTSQQAQRIWVGDRSQAIYGWRGATDAMKHAPGRRLMLSQSFRFGPAIAGEANKWLSILDAPLRLRGFDQIPSRVEPLTAPDAILCRTNSGAVTAVIGALKEGRRVALVGGGQDVRRMAEAARDLRQGRGTDHPELFAFRTWSEVRAYVDDAGAEAADLRVFVKLIEDHTPEGIIGLVDQLVDEHDAQLIVSTAHKAKGREWGRVRIGGDFGEPRPDKDGHVRLYADECMLAYVAVTRAQLVLDREGLRWVDHYSGRTVGPPPPAGLLDRVTEAVAVAADDSGLVPLPTTVENAARRVSPQQDLDDAVAAVLADVFPDAAAREVRVLADLDEAGVTGMPEEQADWDSDDQAAAADPCPYPVGCRVVHAGVEVTVLAAEPAEAVPGWRLRLDLPERPTWVHSNTVQPVPEAMPSAEPASPAERDASGQLLQDPWAGRDAKRCPRCGSTSCTCDPAALARWLQITTPKETVHA